MSGNWPNAVSGKDVVDALRMMEAEFRTGRALICDGAANEIEAQSAASGAPYGTTLSKAFIRSKIISALDCLHHDDIEMVRSILSK